jgi:hypothetical protein
MRVPVVLLPPPILLSFFGSFAQLRGRNRYAGLIHDTPRKPLRVFLQAATRDLNWDAAELKWFSANVRVATALAERGYDLRLVLGDGGHDANHGGAILPDALTGSGDASPSELVRAAKRRRRAPTSSPNRGCSRRRVGSTATGYGRYMAKPPSASQRRRTAAVLMLLVSTLIAAFVGSWLFYVGIASFAVIGAADLAITIREDRTASHRGVKGHS